ncbi:hypothetical protein MHU86_8948 [Fragilaria crotonensis]|nr:hypothetical protein MHU86_8948 [Fragilaria crotonensis]
MFRTALLFAIFVVATQAFVVPANQAVATPAFARVTAPKMIPLEATDVAVSNIAANVNLIAASVDDNGGFFFPIVGLGAIAALILFLSPSTC